MGWATKLARADFQQAWNFFEDAIPQHYSRLIAKLDSVHASAPKMGRYWDMLNTAISEVIIGFVEVTDWDIQTLFLFCASFVHFCANAFIWSVTKIER